MSAHSFGKFADLGGTGQNWKLDHQHSWVCTPGLWRRVYESVANRGHGLGSDTIIAAHSGELNLGELLTAYGSGTARSLHRVVGDLGGGLCIKKRGGVRRARCEAEIEIEIVFSDETFLGTVLTQPGHHRPNK